MMISPRMRRRSALTSKMFLFVQQVSMTPNQIRAIVTQLLYKLQTCFPLKEIWWLCGTGKSITSDNVVSESMSLEAREKNPSNQLLEALTGESGALQAGILPSSGLETQEGDKNMWDSVLKAQTQKAKPAKRKREEKEEAEEVKPKTMREFGPKLSFNPLHKCFLFQSQFKRGSISINNNFDTFTLSQPLP